MASAEGRLRRWGRRALFWIPVLVLLAIGAAATVAVVRLDGPERAAPAVSPPRPERPLLDLRRDLQPLADQVADRRLRQDLTAFVAGMPPDTCLVVHADGVDFDHRENDPQAPASVQKLLTAAAALTVLGPDHRFRTTVTAPAPVDGVVAGDVHLVGGGDPLLAVPGYVDRYDDPSQPFTDLTALADAVVAAGVVRVDGGVVADETRYDQQRYHPTWPIRFRSQGQTGPLSALSVNDGFVRWPADGLFPVEPAPDPAAHAASVFAELLIERGVVVGGGIAVAPAPPDLPELAAVVSPPLTEVVGQMLAQSDNSTAELLLKEIGLATAGEGSFPAGARGVHEALARAGLDVGGLTVVDGSGLSTEDALTCELAVEVLEHRPLAPTITDGLAVAGRSGTLVDRWVGTEIEGRVRAKTGTLNQVTALAGLAATGDGVPARFALIVNVPDRIDPSTIGAQRRLAELLLSHPRRPDLDALRPGAP